MSRYFIFCHPKLLSYCLKSCLSSRIPRPLLLASLEFSCLGSWPVFRGEGTSRWLLPCAHSPGYLLGPGNSQMLPCRKEVLRGATDQFPHSLVSPFVLSLVKIACIQGGSHFFVLLAWQPQLLDRSVSDLGTSHQASVSPRALGGTSQNLWVGRPLEAPLFRLALKKTPLPPPLW